MATSIGFYVPIRVVPKGRPRVTRHHTHTPQRTMENARILAGHFRFYAPREPWDGPIGLRVQFRFRRKNEKQHGHYRWGRGNRAGDLDNRLKQVKDVLGECRFFFDDAQVCSIDAMQAWSDEDGVDVVLTQLEE